METGLEVKIEPVGMLDYEKVLSDMKKEPTAIDFDAVKREFIDYAVVEGSSPHDCEEIKCEEHGVPEESSISSPTTVYCNKETAGSPGNKRTEMSLNPRGKYGAKYSPEDLKNALSCVLEKGWTAYKAAKEYSVPQRTLRDRLKVTPTVKEMPNIKKGRPYCLSAKQETELVSYVVQMQQYGCGLSATDVRREAYKLSRYNETSSFNPDKGIAGWDWWLAFKHRYHLVLRQPVNISMYKTLSSNRENIDGFYDSLDVALNKSGISENPERIWNLDESDFSFVTKSQKVGSTKGTRNVFQQTTAERGETSIVLLTINAGGDAGPSLVIFKGSRLLDDIRKAAPAKCMIAVSKNGLITSEIFLDFIQHFVKLIPAERPILVIMGSHCSHVALEVLKFGQENGIVFLTFPSHTTHLLQPLNIAIFEPMQKLLRYRVLQHLKKKGYKPTRKNFLLMLKEVYHDMLTRRNITSAFSKTGIFPFNREAIKDSKIHEETEAAEQAEKETAGCDSTPSRRLQPIKQIMDLRKKRSATEKSRLFLSTLCEEEHELSDGPEEIKNVRPTKKRKMPKRNVKNDQPSCSSIENRRGRPKKDANVTDVCGSCSGNFSEDKVGENWIQCTKCDEWFHEKCQGLSVYQWNFKCLGCTSESD